MSQDRNEGRRGWRIRNERGIQGQETKNRGQRQGMDKINHKMARKGVVLTTLGCDFINFVFLVKHFKYFKLFFILKKCNKALLSLKLKKVQRNTIFFK